MNDEELVSRYLRQNAPHEDKTPGTFSLRFLVWPTDRRQKPKRVEIGLGTNDRDAAVFVARVLLRGIYALGGRFSGRLDLLGRGNAKRSICEAQPQGRRRWAGLPPKREVDKDDGEQ